MYRLQKWYFDFLTAQGDFVFVYYAVMRLFAFRLHSLTVHLARRQPAVIRTRTVALSHPEQLSTEADQFHLRWAGGEILESPAGWRLNFSGNTCSVDLAFHPAKADRLNPILITAGKKSFIAWRPLGLSYEISGKVSVDDQRLDVSRCMGYADYLDCTCLPRRVPVRSLYWGRLNHPKLDLTFMQAAGQDSSKSWSGLFGRAGDRSFQAGQVSIEPWKKQSPDSGSADGYSLSAMTNIGKIQVAVTHTAPVQQGGFIDQQTSMSALHRKLLRLLAREPHSTKFLARAEVKLGSDGIDFHEKDLALIDEFVTL